MRVRFGRLYEPFSEQKGWSKLPQDLVQRIIECLNPEQGWSARQISRSWAEAARQSCCFQALIPSKCSDTLSDMKTIKQQLAQRLPHVSFTLVFTEPASIAELAELLVKLVSQAIHLGPVKLTARLRIIHTDDDQQLMSHAASIASTSAILLSHSVAVIISLCAADKCVGISTPAMLSQLAPLLQSVDLHSIPSQQLTLQAPSHWQYPSFTLAHLATLTHSPLLTTLYVSDIRPWPNSGPALDASISAVAQLCSLTTLHLTLARKYETMDFQPLSQLTAVQDLALQCPYILSCAEVLSANRQTLRVITLASHGLCAATYQALGQLPAVNRLTIKLWALGDAQGNGFQFLAAKFVHLEIFYLERANTYDLLNWANVCHVMRVHKLTLWQATDGAIGLLRPMPFLQMLSVVNSPYFSGDSLSCRPNVTSLSLISCPAVGGGLKHMLTAALPQVKRLEIQASYDPVTAVRMSPQVSEALGYGHCLEAVDLRGLTGLAASDIRQLKLMFSHSSPHVPVKLPCVQLGQHQPVVNAIQELFLPNLVQLPGHIRHHDWELGRVVKPRHTKGEIVSGVAGLSLCFAGAWAMPRSIRRLEHIARQRAHDYFV